MWSFFSRDPIKDFAYDIGDKVSGLEDKSSWSLHDGKRKSNGEAVSLFIFDIKNSSEALVQLARGAFKRIKTLRHPNILTYLDGLETDRSLYIVTEAVVPLSKHIEENDPQSASNQLAVSWGLHQISKALWFLNNDCSLIHNNVCTASVFVDRAGEWKLGGVDYMYPAAGPESIPPVKLLPMLEKYDPPERGPGPAKRPATKWSVDAWSLGCLIWEVFNGNFVKSTSLKSLGKIPKTLIPNYCELVGANPKSRPNTLQFVENCRAADGFMDNQFVSTMLFLEEIQIQDPEAKIQFFNSLPAALDLFPLSFCKFRILPQLVTAFEYGNVGSSVLSPLFKLGKLLDNDEYQKKIVPCVVKLFSSTDRATRVKLLQQIEMFCEYLSPAVVNAQIFPNIMHGFMDSNPVVREHTIKSVVHLAPKLNYKNLNEEILKHFARLQSQDDQGGIRTNTTVCLGKIACYLHPQIRQKVISSAYIRALKDPFPPARQAGILAMAATHGYFTLAESAHRLLPSLCALTTDPDKGVRDQTFRAIKCFLGKLEKVSENPEVASEIEKDVTSGASLTSSSAGWTGWAVSSMTSLTSKIYKGQRGTDGQRSYSASPAKNVPSASIAQPVDAIRGERKTSVPTPVGASRPIAAVDDDKETTDDQDDQGDGWNDDWDDEDNWGDMETPGSSSQQACSPAVTNCPVTESCDDQVEDTSGDGWDDDGGGWDSFDEPKITLSKTPSSKSPEQKKNKPAMSQFNQIEFEPIEDSSLNPVSSYNWDQTVPSADPNADDFFNSLIDDKKKSSSTSLLKSSVSKKSTDVKSSTCSSQMKLGSSAVGATKQLSKTTAPAANLKTQPSSKSTVSSKKQPPNKKAADGWDDDSWADQW